MAVHRFAAGLRSVVQQAVSQRRRRKRQDYAMYERCMIAIPLSWTSHSDDLKTCNQFNCSIVLVLDLEP